MKVLFVCSGNSKNFDVVPFIKEQGDALQKQGISIAYYPVKGKGIYGYLKAGLKLNKYLKSNSYDIIHAHFIHSACTAIIGAAGRTPVVISLMGSDAYGEYVGVNKITFKSRFSMLLTLLAQPFASAIISKSGNIERHVYLKNKSYIIPNGIDTQKFRPILNPTVSECNAQKQKQRILFLGSKTSVRKNYKLVRDAVEKLNMPEVDLISPYPVSHQEIPALLNSVDLLAVSSLMEGSPNVVKEAMACNCPIVSTDIGDVSWVFGDTKGYFLSSFDTNDFADKIKMALTFSKVNGRTTGHSRILELGLDAETIAKRIVQLYHKVLS